MALAVYRFEHRVVRPIVQPAAQALYSGVDVISGLRTTRGRDGDEESDESKIKKDIEDVLLPGTSGVVAVFEEVWVDKVENALAKADKKAVERADKETAKELKDALAETKKQES